LIKTNHNSEALTLLEGMDIIIDHMNTMFNDLEWGFPIEPLTHRLQNIVKFVLEKFFKISI